MMFHGIATVKENLVGPAGVVYRRVGEQGVITAWLPEDDRYAVMFEGKMGVGNWFTLDRVSLDKFFYIESIDLAGEHRKPEPEVSV